MQWKGILRKQYKDTQSRKDPESNLKNISSTSIIADEISSSPMYNSELVDIKDIELQNNMEIEFENDESNETIHDESKDLFTEDCASIEDTACINIDNTNKKSNGFNLLDGNVRELKTTTVQNNVMHYCSDYLRLDFADTSESVVITAAQDDFASIEQLVKYR